MHLKILNLFNVIYEAVRNLRFWETTVKGFWSTPKVTFLNDNNCITKCARQIMLPVIKTERSIVEKLIELSTGIYSVPVILSAGM